MQPMYEISRFPMTGANEYDIGLIHRGISTEFHSSFPKQILMRPPHRLAGMASALSKDNLRLGMIHKNPQKLAGRVAGSSDYSDINIFTIHH
jgi:hypothetical protein